MQEAATADELRVTNVVFKIVIHDLVSRLQQSRVCRHLTFTEYTNFFVIRGLCHLTLIAFTRSGHVNITGVRRFDQLTDILTLLSEVLDSPPDHRLAPDLAEIVSSTASGAVGREVNLAELVCRYQDRAEVERNELLLCLQRGHFPSLLIRRADRGGCVQLFCSGKFNIVGCKNRSDINRLWMSVNALTGTWSSATSSSAATAGSS